MGYMKLSYVGKANMKQPSEQWIIDTKTTKNSLCSTEVASLGNGRVKLCYSRVTDFLDFLFVQH
jgi:hypothetical protein